MKSRNTRRTATRFFANIATCVVMMGALAACGKESSNPPSPPSTLEGTIAVLEANGALPKLDRSTDIAGPDANSNGVRDDIEAWINAQSVTDKQKAALMQDARALQHTLTTDQTDQAALDATSTELMAAIHCGATSFPTFADYNRYSQKIEAITANTRERTMRYIQYNAAVSGTSNTLPDNDTCTP